MDVLYCTLVCSPTALLSSCVCVIANIGERREAEHVREGFGRKSSRKRTEAKALPAAAGLSDECSVCMTCPTLPSDTHTRPAAASSSVGAQAEGRSHGTLKRAARAARRPSGVNTRSPITKVFDTCILHVRIHMRYSMNGLSVAFALWILLLTLRTSLIHVVLKF